MATLPTPAPAETANLQPVVTPTALAPEPSVVPGPDTGRAEVYAKYEKLYGQPAALAPEQPVTPAADVPAAPVPAAPPQPDMAALVQSLQAELEAVKAQLPKPPPPAALPVEEQFTKLLQEGKPKEAIALIIEAAADAARGRAVQESVELYRVETIINEFNNDIKKNNPDLLILEDTITAKAQQKFAASQAAGKIKSPADYIAEYKAAVNSAVQEARTIVQQIRAAGKADGLTVKTEVLSASTIPPNPISPAHGQTATPATPPVETTEDYLARRQAIVAARKGMGL